MTELPLVSIVTPCFNAAAYIEATITSVLAQDYPSIEYIVMDGGSTDGTVDILRRYEGRLQFVSAADAGTADAVNRGFERCHGSIFAWLNADDVYLPGALRKGVDRLQANPAVAVVYGAASWIDAASNVLAPYPSASFDRDQLAYECFICQPAAFMRSDAFRRAGMLDANDHFAFDYDLWIRLAREADFEYLNEPLALSRMHSANKTLGARKQILKAGMNVLKKHYGYVPFSWVYSYVNYILHPRDQFFEPMQGSVTTFLLSLPAGCWINRKRMPNYVREWAVQARRGAASRTRTRSLTTI